MVTLDDIMKTFYYIMGILFGAGMVSAGSVCDECVRRMPALEIVEVLLMKDMYVRMASPQDIKTNINALIDTIYSRKTEPNPNIMNKIASVLERPTEPIGVPGVDTYRLVLYLPQGYYDNSGLKEELDLLLRKHNKAIYKSDTRKIIADETQLSETTKEGEINLGTPQFGI